VATRPVRPATGSTELFSLSITWEYVRVGFALQ
jgi:hypothetical protein